MDSNLSVGNWNEQKNILKKRLADLTENELLFSEDKKKEILNKVQKKMGKTKEEMKKIVGEL